MKKKSKTGLIVLMSVTILALAALGAMAQGYGEDGRYWTNGYGYHMRGQGNSYWRNCGGRNWSPPADRPCWYDPSQENYGQPNGDRNLVPEASPERETPEVK